MDGCLDDLLDVACAAAWAGAEVVLAWWTRASELRIEEEAASFTVVGFPREVQSWVTTLPLALDLMGTRRTFDTTALAAAVVRDG
jgi:hypothetical protein